MKPLMRFLAYASGLCVVALAPGLARGQAIAADRLEHAYFLEQTVGDWDAAAAIYREVSVDPQAADDLRELARERLSARFLVKFNPGAPAEEAPKGGDAGKLGAALGEAAAAIKEAYAFDAPDEQLLEGALAGMLEKLDGESSYLTAAQVKEMSQSIDQQIVGVGLQLKLEDGDVVVVTPVPGSPAEKAGVVPGDVVTAVGETKLADSPEELRLVAAVKLIRGPAGEKVAITLEKGKGGESRKVEIERATIELESIRGDQRVDGAWRTMIDDERKIGYVRILQFGRRTSEELKAALDKLKASGMKGLVIDLRDNSGGLLTQGVETADLFLPAGQIVAIRGKDGKSQTFDAKAEGTLGDFPIAVLVNRNTASAAEIVAASLQDHDRATIVGERTFGRGIVQGIFPLASTGGALKLTTAVYTRPSGKPLKRDRSGGEPKAGDDVGGVFPSEGSEIAYSDDELRAYHEYRQQRDFPTPGAEAKDFADRQLERALAVVREKIGS